MGIIKEKKIQIKTYLKLSNLICINTYIFSFFFFHINNSKEIKKQSLCKATF